MTLLGTPDLVTSHLASTDVDSQSPALATIPRVIGGNSRLYYEHLTGATVSGSTRCAPLNPRGLIGHDHSGPPFGKALRHTFWNACFPVQEDGTKTNEPCPPMLYTQDAGGWSGTRIGMDKSFWVPAPACYEGGAYANATVDATYVCYETFSSGNAYLLLQVRDHEAGQWTNYVSIELAATSNDGELASATGTLKLYPWGMNEVRIRLIGEDITETVTLWLASISFSCVP